MGYRADELLQNGWRTEFWHRTSTTGCLDERRTPYWQSYAGAIKFLGSERVAAEETVPAKRAAPSEERSCLTREANRGKDTYVTEEDTKRKKISSEVSEVEKSKIEGKKATAEYNATWERGRSCA